MTNSVKIQFASDLHLEFKFKLNVLSNQSNIEILCLLGDICVCGVDEDWTKYTTFIKHVSTKYKHIILITGNHEYYTNKKSGNQSIQKINLKIKQFTQTLPNVHFLNNEIFQLNINNKDIIFLGTTLWTFVDAQNKKFIQSTMNDYSNIFYNEKKFNIENMLSLHSDAVKFIEQNLSTYSKKPNQYIILLTHHKPIKGNISNILSQAYESDIKALQKYKQIIDIAAHGHTHKHMNELIDEIMIISNPKGYPNQQTKFIKNFSITL